MNSSCTLLKENGQLQLSIETYSSLLLKEILEDTVLANPSKLTLTFSDVPADQATVSSIVLRVPAQS